MTVSQLFFLDEKKGAEYCAKNNVEEAPLGEFVGYASVFDVVDVYGDRVKKGAFAATLAEHEKTGAPVPILYGHDSGNPLQNVGEIVEAKEDDHGLLIRARLDMDTPEGAKVYRLLKSRRLRELSIGFIPRDYKPNSFGGNDLLDVELLEVSVVPVAANREALVTDVKSDAATPTTAHTAAAVVAATAATPDENDEESTPQPDGAVVIDTDATPEAVEPANPDETDATPAQDVAATNSAEAAEPELSNENMSASDAAQVKARLALLALLYK